MVYDLGFDFNYKKDLSMKVDYKHSRNTEASISCPWKITSLSINSDLFRFSRPGLMDSSFKNPAKSSESASVSCPPGPGWDAVKHCFPISFSFLSFQCANSASCNSTTSVFILFKNKTIFFLLIWTVESLYIQRNGTEIWIHLTILRINFIQFLWTENQRWGNAWIISFTSPQP